MEVTGAVVALALPSLMSRWQREGIMGLWERPRDLLVWLWEATVRCSPAQVTVPQPREGPGWEP